MGFGRLCRMLRMPVDMFSGIGGFCNGVNMRTVEDIIHQIDKNNESISELLVDNRKLARELKELPKQDWDWISVSNASKLFDMCPAKIYERVNSGKISSKHIGSKIYVSKSEIMAINDEVV